MKLEQKRWLMLAATMIANICIGSGYAWSVFQDPLIRLYNWSPVQTSLAFTLILGISALPMVVVGKIQDYVQPRYIIFTGGLIFGLGTFATGYIASLHQLYLLYGVVAGLGMGIVYSGGLSNMIRFFPDRKGLCSGLLAAGMGSGALVIAPLAAVLIDSLGVLTTFKVLGILFTIIICGLSFLIETAPLNFKPAMWEPTNDNTKTSPVDKDWKEMLGSPSFYFIAAMFILGTIAGLMVIGHASSILQELVGLTAKKSAVLVGVLSLANTTGRVFWGWLSDRLGCFPTCIFLYIIVSVSMFGLIALPRNQIFVAAMMVVGLCYGGFMSMIASLTAEVYGTKNLPVNFGIMFLAFGVAAFIGPRLAAIIKVANQGDYSQAFMVAGILSIVGIAFTIITMYINKRETLQHHLSEN